jgi:hypothetical protein
MMGNMQKLDVAKPINAEIAENRKEDLCPSLRLSAISAF